MNNTMEYKGYIGSVEFSETDQILFGKVQGIRSLISYEGTTVAELIDDFHGAVDDYLELCSASSIILLNLNHYSCTCCRNMPRSSCGNLPFQR